MRECGGCTLCCKVSRVVDSAFNKPPNTWCRFCAVGEGCRIYGERPKVCRDFRCRWLDSDMPDEARPDRVGFYVTMEGDIAKICVDQDRMDAWHFSPVIETLRQNSHVLVSSGPQLTFIVSPNLSPPEKLVVDWTL